ncbi:MAG: 50S ribosomal protein L29 [Chlamydiota bacterium]
MIKIQELREQSTEQLQNLIEDLDREIFALRNTLATSHKLEKPHNFREKKKRKAQVLTLLSERARDVGKK